MFKVHFLGAAGTVTGSCYLVECGEFKFIVDCGMFQGPEVEKRNAEPWPFDAHDVDFALLTHAHIDHSGLLPKLTKYGFTGEIFATTHTISIASLLLMDSAKIQDINRREGKFLDNASTKSVQYYNTQDAEYAISRFRSVKFHESFSPRPGIEIEYIPAGHILGAASIIISLDGKRIVFSGDVGRVEHILINSFDVDDDREVDYVIMESLYGGEMHPSRESSVYEMIDLIKQTTDNGGNVLIPAFAVERTQNVLIDLKHAKSAGVLAEDLQVFVDSPLATKVTDIYINAAAALKMPMSENEESSRRIFEFPGLHTIRNSRQSARLKTQHNSVLIAGSGMINGGRILTHVINHLPNPKTHLIVVGYQAEETYGRALIEGAKELVIEGIKVPVRGKVTYLQGFSAHGDESDLLKWVGRYKSNKLSKIMLVHAEAERANAFKQTLANNEYGAEVVIPNWKDTIEL